jgi:hypothetical protein
MIGPLGVLYPNDHKSHPGAYNPNALQSIPYSLGFETSPIQVADLSEYPSLAFRHFTFLPQFSTTFSWIQIYLMTIDSLSGFLR